MTPVIAWLKRKIWRRPIKDGNPCCLYCKKTLRRGDLVGRDIHGRFIHAGFQYDGSFCETGGIASGWWNGHEYVPIDWSKP